MALSQQYSNITCVLPNASLMFSCYPYVTYLVPSNYDQYQEDQMALSSSLDNGQCPYYSPITYQCRKHFPPCTESPTSNGTVATLVKLCTTSCYSASTWMNGLCQRFSSEYFTEECTEDMYYSNTQPPVCALTTAPDVVQAWWWKMILVGILGLIAFLLLGSYLRTRLRERMTPEDLDREDEQRQRRSQTILRIRRMFGFGSPEAYVPLTANETEMNQIPHPHLPAQGPPLQSTPTSRRAQSYISQEVPTHSTHSTSTTAPSSEGTSSTLPSNLPIPSTSNPPETTQALTTPPI